MGSKVTLLATLILFATALFAQSKKDIESDYAKCVSARDSIQNAYGELSKSFESLSKTYDSITAVARDYNNMYTVIKDKLVRYNFAPTDMSRIVDSIQTSQREAVSSLNRNLSDSIAALKSENEALKTKVTTVDEKSQGVEDLKKLKELLDAGILTQEEFEAKKTAVLEKF